MVGRAHLPRGSMFFTLMVACSPWSGFQRLLLLGSFHLNPFLSLPGFFFPGGSEGSPITLHRLGRQ